MSCFFESSDYKTLEKMVPAKQAAQTLGLIVRSDGTLGELCAAHADSKPGTVKYDQRRKKFKCFACGALFSSYDILVKYGGMSKYDACVKLAELAGVTGDYEQKGHSSKIKKEKEKMANRRILTSEEKKVLGLPIEDSVTAPCGYTLDRPEGDFVWDGEGYTEYRTVLFDPLAELARNDYPNYKKVVRNICQNRLMVLESLLTKGPSADLARAIKTDCKWVRRIKDAFAD